MATSAAVTGVDRSQASVARVDEARPWLAVAAIAAACVLLELLVAQRSGYHRDELYFLAASRRLAWGFVDQPPLTPLLAGLADRLFGGSLIGFRLVPALAGAGVVALAAATARELGGGRFAQVFAALAVAASTVFLVFRHLFNTGSFDLLAWAAVLWLVTRLLRTGDGRLWLAVGAVAGVGLLNKHLVLVLGLGLVAGLLVTGQRKWLGSPWLWGGGALAAVIFLPNLLWQAANDWPARDMAAVLSQEHGGLEDRLMFLPLQLLMPNPFLAPVWLAGLWWLFRAEAARPFRPLAWAYPVVVTFFLVTGGQPYYPAGLYVALLAAGAVVVERRYADRSTARRVGVAVLVLSGFLPLPVTLPVLPPSALAEETTVATIVDEMGTELGEQVGWPQLAQTVADVHASLPAQERADAVILTLNYGEAGAIERYGPALGLPMPFSGHNSYADWGPPPEPPATTIAVGRFDEAELAAVFDEVTHVARIDNRLDVANEEQGAPIYVCRKPRTTWAEAWPALTHLS